jgi:hypothetical protein
MYLTRLIALLGTLFLFGGCASFSPKSIGAEPQAVTLAWSGPVSVVPLTTDNGMSDVFAPMKMIPIDLNDYSESLAELVRLSIEKAGGATGGEERIIAVQVTYLDFLFQGPCLLDYRVVLGDETPFGDQTTGQDKNLKRACRAAFEAAVSQIVGHPRTVRYLGGN